MKTVKYIRVALGAAVLILTAALVTQGYTDWAARHLLTVNLELISLGACIAWLIITLLLGRVYCSVACPLGTLQDIASWLDKRIQNRGKGNYHFMPGDWRLRGITLLLVAVCSSDRRSTYVAHYSDPLTLFMQDAGIAYLALGNVVAIVITLAVLFLAWRGGRTFCNTVCPIGTTLGAVSQFSLMQLDINPDLCVGCGACERECKSSCVNALQHTIDHSRCVMCMNCAAACPNDAIKYRVGRHRLTTPLMRRTTATAGMAKQNP